MKEIPLSEVEQDLARYLRLATQDDIVITRDGRPAGVLIGFPSEDAWIDYCVQHDLRIWREAHEEYRDQLDSTQRGADLEHDPRFVHRIEGARQSLRTQGSTRLEEIGAEAEPIANESLRSTT